MTDGSPRHVSDIITDLAADPETPPHVRDTLKGESYRFHKDCPCAECMRAYLRATEAA